MVGEGRVPLGALGGLVLLAAVVRVAVYLLADPSGVSGDEHYYLRVGREIAFEGRHYDRGMDSWALRPPLGAAWVSLFVDEGRGASASALRSVVPAQIALGAAIVALTAVVGSQLFDRRTGIAAGVLAAFQPTLAAYGHYLMPASLVIALGLGALACFLQGVRTWRWPWAVAAGLLLGAAALTREVGMLLAPILVARIGLEIRAGAQVRRAIVFLCLTGVVAASTVAPWSIRNTLRFDRFVPVSTMGWASMRVGNTIASPDWMSPDVEELTSFYRRWFALGELERMELAREEFVPLFVGEQPTWILKKTVRNSAHLFSLDKMVVHKLYHGVYGEVGQGAARVFLVVVVGAWLALVALATLGAASERDPRRACIGLGTIAIVVAFHVVAISNSRYVVPLIPFLCMYAAWFARDPRAAFARWTPLRGGLAVAWLAFFLIVALPYQAQNKIVPLWRGEAPVEAR